jgi:hypothetical protein
VARRLRAENYDEKNGHEQERPILPLAKKPALQPDRTDATTFMFDRAAETMPRRDGPAAREEQGNAVA